MILDAARRLIQASRLYRWAGPPMLYGRNYLFDLRHHVHTAGIVPVNKLGASGDNAAHSIMYDTVDASLLADIFRRIPAALDQFIFVDFGSGKGKALLIAALFPFRRVIGVEFSRRLADIARANIKSYRGPARGCCEVEVVHMDAAFFLIPEEQAVLYFYNPFRAPVMRQVMENVLQSLKQTPRTLFLVYVNPELANLIEATGKFRKIDGGDWHSTYQSI